MRKIRIILFIIVVLLLITLFVTFNYNEIKLLSKHYFGGIVVNKTSRVIKVYDGIKNIDLPENTSSRTSGVFDADFIIIEQPVIFEDKLYKQGVIKICDYATVETFLSDNIIHVRSLKGANWCKLINDYGWQESIENKKVE